MTSIAIGCAVLVYSLLVGLFVTSLVTQRRNR